MGRKPDQTEIPRVSAKNLAAVLGITPGRVSQLATAGTFAAGDDGLYDLTLAVPAYIAGRIPKTENGEKPSGKKRREEAMADIAEMERDELAGKLHKDEDIVKAWGGVLMAFRSKMLALPTKVAPRVEGLASIAEVEAEIRTLVNEALNELAKHDPAKFDG